MSRLDELIQEYCPNGVEFKTVGDVATITRGHVMSKDYIKENIRHKQKIMANWAIFPHTILTESI
ncbi:MAG: hypothetical protein SOX11_04500 [Lachnospiraceae bacterium]|nr:hypothetical protein [Lachnospiraceae bacterium]MDY3222383.1 hypothetical protein [Lachnospiraceae bacterium]